MSEKASESIRTVGAMIDVLSTFARDDRIVATWEECFWYVSGVRHDERIRTVVIDVDSGRESDGRAYEIEEEIRACHAKGLA